MNYKISLQEMDKLAMDALSKNRRFSLEEMKSQIFQNQEIKYFKSEEIVII